MAENQKNSVKKSFWQRNLFLLIILTLIIVVWRRLFISEIIFYRIHLFLLQSKKLKKEVIEPKIASLVRYLNSKELQEKLDRLESLILELAQNVQNIPQTHN